MLSANRFENEPTNLFFTLNEPANILEGTILSRAAVKTPTETAKASALSLSNPYSIASSLTLFETELASIAEPPIGVARANVPMEATMLGPNSNIVSGNRVVNLSSKDAFCHSSDGSIKSISSILSTALFNLLVGLFSQFLFKKSTHCFFFSFIAGIFFKGLIGSPGRRGASLSICLAANPVAKSTPSVAKFKN
ncbi:MAG: hypothetical protein DDT40_01550 [candidate division WS2 bacterium]|nr:hypothetical protein [Candidatus Psychracetigena formicireducens]